MKVADSLIDTAPCGFIAFGDDGVVLDVNRTLLDTLGYAYDDVVGQHVDRLMNVGSRIFYQTHWFPLLRLHGRAEEVYLVFRSKTGADVGMLSYASRNGERYECIFVHVRERAKYEDQLLQARRKAEEYSRMLEEQAAELEMQQEQLREASEAKSTFLAVMSHELRTPLNAISGYVQILELGIPGELNDAQREILSRLDTAGHHLLGLINEVLNLSRIESGQVDYQVEEAALAEIVADIRLLIEPQAATRELTLEVIVDPDVVVCVDVEKTNQILLNLLSNAVKFSHEGDSIVVRAVRDGRVVRVRVEDSGIGIPANKLDAVFEPFVQVDSSRTRTAQGTGLGLAISRNLARGMGGELTVESVVGKGSTFILTVPAGSS